VLRAEVSEIKRNTQRDWFLIGAGVLFGGILLGLILPRLKLRRRSGWGDL
jgi:SH3 domain protein